jgi:hypothetical protein
MKMTNKIQLCRIIYYSVAAVYVSSDIFISSSGAPKLYYSFWYYTRVSLPAGIIPAGSDIRV